MDIDKNRVRLAGAVPDRFELSDEDLLIISDALLLEMYGLFADVLDDLKDRMHSVHDRELTRNRAAIYRRLSDETT